MSEEEKKAILELKDFKKDKDCRFWIGENGEKAIDVILSLIENQQKEIEELKAINNMQKYRIEVIDERELIPKSKIKEKIEEIRNQGNSKYCKYVTYRTRNDLVVEKDGLIDVLQELLESED